MNRHLMVVDGSNLLARAWFTLREKQLDALPEKVGRMLVSAARRWEVTHLVVALDSSTCFRRELLPEYKADRSTRKGPDIQELTEALRPSFAAWNVAVREQEGFEADDVIASLVQRAISIECPTSILTEDTDLLQLVSDDKRVRVLRPGGEDGEDVLDDEAVLQYFEGHKKYQAALQPDQLLDLRTIAGGKDNLPRIEMSPPCGFTTKRAAELLALGATLDTLVAGEFTDLKPREIEWLQTGGAAALERREILRLRCNVGLKGSGASDIRDQRIPWMTSTDAPVPPPTSEVEGRKVRCAGGCGREEIAEPHHDPTQVYCFGCGVRAGREEARLRRLEREGAHA